MKCTFKFAVLIVALFCIGFVGINVTNTYASGGRTIYTKSSGSASDYSGNGSISNPYANFQTALDNATNGDTIYILDKGFLNATDNSPLIIDKNITIKGNNSIFMVRTSGIVLKANVTFENIQLSFASRYHDGIFANGYSLTLNNVSCESGARKVDIFGGGLYTNGSNVSTSGSNAIITIRGGGDNFGNIYAGALNGDYTGNVTINMSGLMSSRNTDVHISGADEPYVNLDDMFNLEEPAAPTANANHTITGTVNVEIKNCNISYVKKTSETSAGNTTITIDTDGKYCGALSVVNCNNLLVKGGGTFSPVECSSKTKVTLTGSSAIDLSMLVNPVLAGLTSQNCSLNKLILGKNQYLTITEIIGGNFIFETENGYNNHSGNAQYDFAYIRLNNQGTAENANFSYTCVPGMEMTLDKINNYTSSDVGVTYKMVWKTSEAEGYSPFPITGLTINNPSITTTVNGFKNSVTYNAGVTVSNVYTAQDCYFDLVPILYKVKYMGVEYTGEAKFDGYGYYAEIPQLGMSFMAMSDYDLSGAKITVYTYLDGSGNTPKSPETGIYTITILPYSEGSQITKTVKLIITDEGGNYPDEPTTEPPTTEPPTTKPQTTESPTTEPQTKLQIDESTDKPTKGEAENIPDKITEDVTKEIFEEGSEDVNENSGEDNKLPKAVIYVIISSIVLMGATAAFVAIRIKRQSN